MTTPSPLQTLAETAPPRSIRFHNVQQAHARILELENSLGIPNAGFIYNVGKANGRVAELEAMRSLRPAPATPPPAAAALALAAPRATGDTITFASLAALHEKIFGQASTYSVLRNDSADWTPAVARLDAAQRACDEAAVHGIFSPALDRANALKAGVREAIKAERIGPERAQFERLRESFFNAGVSVPGLSYAALAASDRTPANRMSATTLADANAFAREWVELTTSPEKLALATSHVAHLAQKFIRSEKGKA